MPTHIKIWLIDKETGNRWGIRLHPFKTEEHEQNDYKIIYDDARLNGLYKIFSTGVPRKDSERIISAHTFNKSVCHVEIEI